jgi:hypothetical protein
MSYDGTTNPQPDAAPAGNARAAARDLPAIYQSLRSAGDYMDQNVREPLRQRLRSAGAQTTDRQRSLLRDMETLRQTIDKVDADGNLNEMTRASRLSSLRAQYKQKLRELNDPYSAAPETGSPVAAEPRFSPAVQAHMQRAREIVDAFRAAANDPKLSRDERIATLMHYRDALANQHDEAVEALLRESLPPDQAAKEIAARRARLAAPGQMQQPFPY